MSTDELAAILSSGEAVTALVEQLSGMAGDKRQILALFQAVQVDIADLRALL
jgi:hypothetical protein